MLRGVAVAAVGLSLSAVGSVATAQAHASASPAPAHAAAAPAASHPAPAPAHAAAAPAPARAAGAPGVHLIAPMLGARVTSHRPTMRWAGDAGTVDLCRDVACAQNIASIDGHGG